MIKVTSPTFHNWIGLQDLLLDPRMLPTDGRKKLQNQLRGFSLSSSTFPTDDDTLVSLSSLHEIVSVVCCGKDVWGLFSDLFVLVAIDVCLIIDG